MSWYRQSYRHSLASRGIRTSMVAYFPQVAMERFDLDKLRFLGQGRDRTAFAFQDDPTKVLKLAHNPTGIRQNKMELEEVGAKPLYFGKDFVVMQRARPLEDVSVDTSAAMRKWEAKDSRLKQLERLLYRVDEGENVPETSREERLLKVLGLENLIKAYPNLAAGDLAKASSWGILPNGRMVLIDKGGLDFEVFEPDRETMIRWEDIIRKREEARISGREPLVYLTLGDEYVPGNIWNVSDFEKTGRIKDQWNIRPKVPKTTRQTE